MNFGPDRGLNGLAAGGGGSAVKKQSGFGSGLAGGGLFPVIVPAAGFVVFLLRLTGVRRLRGLCGLDRELLDLHSRGLSAFWRTAGSLRGGVLFTGVGVVAAAFD